jgi:hypothetical protein
MLRQISLLIITLHPFLVLGQVGTISIKKPKSDTINIVGQWIRCYDKTADGKVVALDKDKIDTLNFYPNNKFLKQQAGSEEYANWKLDQKLKRISLDDINFTMTIEGQVVNTHFDSSSEDIGKYTTDTLTLLDFSETYPEPTLYNTRYYYRKK